METNKGLNFTLKCARTSKLYNVNIIPNGRDEILIIAGSKIIAKLRVDAMVDETEKPVKDNFFLLFDRIGSSFAHDVAEYIED